MIRSVRAAVMLACWVNLSGCIILTLPTMVANGDPYGGAAETEVFSSLIGKMSCDELMEVQSDIEQRGATLAEIRAAKATRLEIIERKKADRSCES